MLSGSSYGTITDCGKLDGGNHDVIVGVEHRLTSDAAQEEWNQHCRCGSQVAVDDVISPKEGEDVGLKRRVRRRVRKGGRREKRKRGERRRRKRKRRMREEEAEEQRRAEESAGRATERGKGSGRARRKE